MKLHNKRGTALVITLLVIFVLLIVGSSFILRAVNEWYAALRERRIVQISAISEGGAAAGVDKLKDLINTQMLNTINVTNPSTVATRARNCADRKSDCLNGIDFLVRYVKEGAQALLTKTGTQVTFNQPSADLGNGNYTFNIVITEKSRPVKTGTDIWEFPFNYQIQAQGKIGTQAANISLFGDFTVQVRRDNFARYALFTAHHGLPSGGTVWFTNHTYFAGPLHTNERFSFTNDPVFDGTVTQHLTQAQFYNNGNSFQAAQDSNPPFDVPVFNATYTRGVDEIVLASSVQKSDLYSQARGTDSASSNGIYVANADGAVKAGIYVMGDSTIQMGVDANNNAQYTITQGSTTKTITVDIPNNQTKVATQGGSTVTYTGKPDGVDNVGTILYVDGQVTSLKGTVQKDTEITISAENDIVLSDNVVYQEYNPAVGTPGQPGYVAPNADGKTNLLGLLSWGGDIRVGTTAPANVNVHGVVMAQNGVFQVDNYDSRSPNGTATLLGGAITKFYGAFGTFNGTTGQMVSGYGRNFVYDTRNQMGSAPPYFPSMKTFVAFANDISDKVAYREGSF